MATRTPASLPAPLPIAPTVEAWRAMTPAERERFLVQANDALSDPLRTMQEGRPHRRAKTRAADMLGLHFKAMGRVIYVQEEMAVLYPGEQVFTPDVLAVVDVPQADDDARMAWVVADEGRGLDLALEVLHRGDRHKDLVANVERYARLGIAEYFVYDRARQQIHGHRLPVGARRYERIVPQGGRYHSTVLGLELSILGDELRFFQGMAELPGTSELLDRLNGMVESLGAKAERAEAKAERAEVKAERAEVKAERAVLGLRDAILALLAARGIACPDDARALLMAESEPDVLRLWLSRAVTAGSAAEVFSPA